MTKNRLYREVHKGLFIFENELYSNYDSYLNSLIVTMSGLKKSEVLSDSIILLKGLRNLGSEVDKKDVRKIFLKIMNRIDREYEDGDE